MSVEMKTLTIGDVTYTPVDETARDAINLCERKDSGDVTDLLGTNNRRYVFSSAVTGMPIDGEWWFVDAISSTSTDITVIASRVVKDAAMYIRTCANNTWGDWIKIVTADTSNNVDVNVLNAANVTVSGGIGSNSDKIWIDAAGDAYFTEVHVGSNDNYTQLLPATNTVTKDSTNPITSGAVYTELNKTVPVTKGGTGYTSIAGTDYTTVRYRGSALYEDTALDSLTSSDGTNGAIYWGYGNPIEG